MTSARAVTVALLCALGAAKSAQAEPETNVIRQLSIVVERCVSRRDTDHPVFHGCIDWHSSVHAHWALLFAARALHDEALAHRISGRLTDEAMARELRDFERGDWLSGRFERPYGRAWYLQLARDGIAWFGLESLRPLADHHYAVLLDYADEGGGQIDGQRYQSATWYLYQLLRWAEFTGDAANAERVRGWISSRVGGVDAWPEPGNQNTGFFDARLMAALALAASGERGEIWTRLVAEVGSSPPSPVTAPFATAHQGGLDYSRAWGLLALHQATGESRFRAIAKAHMAVMDESLGSWSRDYGAFGHWVAQFGLLAHALAADGLTLPSEPSASRTGPRSSTGATRP